MNTQLLQQIAEIIVQRPLQFDMCNWFSVGRTKFGNSIPECGTAACIGGWAVTLHAQNRGKKPKPSKGAELFWGTGIRDSPDYILGLTDSQAVRLFYDRCWPLQFQASYDAAESEAERAEIAAQRIAHFIATEGEE